MIHLTPAERSALRLIRTWQAEYKNSPNAAEIGAEIGRSRGGVYHILRRLQLKGYLDLVHVRRRMLIVPLYWE